MPRNNDAVAIGRMDCLKDQCGDRTTVYQAANGYFYTRCPKCKARQTRDLNYQVAVWQRIEPIEGAVDKDGAPVVIRRPPNVPAEAGTLGCAHSGTAPVVTVVAPEKPAAEPDAEPVPVGTAPASVAVPESTEKPTAKPQVPQVHEPAPVQVQKTVPEPKGAGTANTGSGFWWFMGTLALATGAAVAWAQKQKQEGAAA